MTNSQLRLLRALTPNWPDTPQDRVYDFKAEKWINETGSQEGVSEVSASCVTHLEQTAIPAGGSLVEMAGALRPGRVDETETGAIDPRDPDPSREGIFQYHNCYRCEHGKKPCVSKEPVCPYPHARND